MKHSFLSLLVFAVLRCSAIAQFSAAASPYHSADTLEFFVGKSPLVVVASVGSALDHTISRPIYTPGVIKPAPRHLLTAITIERVLHGSAPADKNIMVSVFRMEAQNGVSGIPIREKQRFIFFLQPCEPELQTRINGKRVEWRTVDVWFGAYPFDTMLADKIEELVKAK